MNGNYNPLEEESFLESSSNNGNDFAANLKTIDDIFVRHILKRDVSTWSTPDDNKQPDNLFEPDPQPKLKRRAQSTGALNLKKKKKFGELKHESEHLDFAMNAYDVPRPDFSQKTREELEAEVNMFNEELRKKAAELGLAMEGSNIDLTMKKRREKWSAEEMNTLWGAISLYGNNWTAISKIVPGRNYFQVKDKGRRELCGRGWETGRKKSEGVEAMLHAQAIAQSQLQQYFHDRGEISPKPKDEVDASWRIKEETRN